MNLMGYRSDHGMLKICYLDQDSELAILIKTCCVMLKDFDRGSFYVLNLDQIKDFIQTIQDQEQLLFLEDAENMALFGCKIFAFDGGDHDKD